MKHVGPKPGLNTRPRGYKVANYRRGKMVFIYAIRCGLYVKIGIAKDVGQRMLAFQAGNPFPLMCLTKQKVLPELAGKAELIAHTALQRCHHHGEWFMVGKAEATSVIKAAIKRAVKEQTPDDKEYAIIRRLGRADDNEGAALIGALSRLRLWGG